MDLRDNYFVLWLFILYYRSNEGKSFIVKKVINKGLKRFLKVYFFN